MFRKREIDVLVVGAGPVGAFAGLLLAERGLRVQVIDEQFRTTSRSYALAIHPRTLELLDDVGLAQPLIARGRKLESMAFFERGDKKAEVRFGELSSRFPFLLTIPQSALEELLEERLKNKGVPVMWNHRLSQLNPEGGRATATIEELTKISTGYSVATTEWVIERELVVRAPFVIGADGHRSRVRRALGIEYESVGPSQFFAVFEFGAQGAALSEARIGIDGGRTSVLWPLGEDHFRFSFEVGENEEAETRREKSRLAVLLGEHSFQYLEPSELQRLAAERAPWFKGQIGDMAWSMAIRFERRLAAEFGRGNIWLAGDSAHLAAPVSVMSMNVGLREAAELADGIHAVLRKDAPADKLEAYGRERAREWRHLMHAQVRTTGEATPWVHDHAAQIVQCVPAAGDDRVKLLKQLGIVEDPPQPKK